jgi:hypothetical protein
MATPTRLANKTIASLEAAFARLDKASADMSVLNEYLETEMSEARLNMDRRRQARAGEAAAAVARITTNLWVIERILNDARLGRFDDLRYPEQ